MSAYIISRLLPLAEQEIATQEKLILSDRDRDLLMDALENPLQLQGKLKTILQEFV